MTKYILHGGNTGTPNEHNAAFYQEWAKDFRDDFVPTILLVYFSRPQDEWRELEKQDTERFARYTNDRKVNFVVENSDISMLRDQIKAADVVYVRGGTTKDLMQALQPIRGELRQLLDGKVYAGSSAGVMMLSHHTRSVDTDWMDGFGVIPINSVVHWSENMRENLESFKRSHQDNSYEYLLLPETEFVVQQYS
jgi:peptidase E